MLWEKDALRKNKPQRQNFVGGFVKITKVSYVVAGGTLWPAIPLLQAQTQHARASSNMFTTWNIVNHIVMSLSVVLRDIVTTSQIRPAHE